MRLETNRIESKRGTGLSFFLQPYTRTYVHTHIHPCVRVPLPVLVSLSLSPWTETSSTMGIYAARLSLGKNERWRRSVPSGRRLDSIRFDSKSIEESPTSLIPVFRSFLGCPLGSRPKHKKHKQNKNKKTSLILQNKTNPNQTRLPVLLLLFKNKKTGRWNPSPFNAIQHNTTPYHTIPYNTIHTIRSICVGNVLFDESESDDDWCVPHQNPQFFLLSGFALSCAIFGFSRETHGPGTVHPLAIGQREYRVVTNNKVACACNE